MIRLAEILQEVTRIQNQQAQGQRLLEDNNKKLQELTKEWQDICSHPMEYLDELESGEVKCCACGFIIPAGDNE